MAQTAAQIAEANSVISALSSKAISPNTVIVGCPNPVSIARVIAILLSLLAAG